MSPGGLQQLNPMSIVLETQVQLVPIKSAIAKAMKSALKHWDLLLRYFLDSSH